MTLQPYLEPGQGFNLGLRAVGWAAFVLAIWLLCAPVAPVLQPELALMWHKLVAVFGGRWTCILAGLVVLAISITLLDWARRREQSMQDGRAAQIMATLRQDPAAQVPPFLLYLRAFETIGRLRVPLFVRLRRLTLQRTRGVTDDLES